MPQLPVQNHEPSTSGSHESRAITPSVRAGRGFAAAVAATAVLGTLAMRGRGSPRSWWFLTRRKPSYQPPNWVFGPVWTVLYAAIAYSGWRVWRKPASPQRTRALALWGTQLACNAAWTPLFFRAHRPGLALVDIVALDAAAAAYAASARKVDAQAAIVVSPYLAWLGFATLLNASIVAKNR
jgi:benzodiazapine receptor